MVDLGAIRQRNEGAKGASGWDCDTASMIRDIDTLIAEVERLSGDCFDCGEMHKTHPTREGAVGWKGHACRCVRSLSAEVERLTGREREIREACDTSKWGSVGSAMAERVRRILDIAP